MVFTAGNLSPFRHPAAPSLVILSIPLPPGRLPQSCRTRRGLESQDKGLKPLVRAPDYKQVSLNLPPSLPSSALSLWLGCFWA